MKCLEVNFRQCTYFLSGARSVPSAVPVSAWTCSAACLASLTSVIQFLALRSETLWSWRTLSVLANRSVCTALRLMALLPSTYREREREREREGITKSKHVLYWKLFTPNFRPWGICQGLEGNSQADRRTSDSVRLCCLMSSDVGWHIRDMLRSMREHGSI